MLGRHVVSPIRKHLIVIVVCGSAELRIDVVPAAQYFGRNLILGKAAYLAYPPQTDRRFDHRRKYSHDLIKYRQSVIEADLSGTDAKRRRSRTC